MTAALTYLISVYAQISTLRVAASSARTAAQGPEQAARQVVEGDPAGLADLHAQLLAIDEGSQPCTARLPL